MLLLTLLVLAAHFSQNQGFALMRFNPNIAKLITVECSSNGMNVSFGQKLAVSFLKQEQDYVKSLEVLGFSIGTIGTCMGNKFENGSYWETNALFTHYSCDIQSHPFPGGVNYTANAVILVRKARYYEIPISCSILDKPIRDTEMFARREDRSLVPMKVESIPVNSQMHYGFTVNSTVLPKFEDLYTYTLNCALSSYPTGPTTFVLAGGCPLYDGHSFMSAIYQAQTTLHWSVNTGVHANFDKNTIPKESITDGTARVTFGCDVFICTNNTRHRILGIPICSNTNLCRHGISIYENQKRIPATVMKLTSPVIEIDMTRQVERQIMEDPLYIPGPYVPPPTTWEKVKNVLVYVVPIVFVLLTLALVFFIVYFVKRSYGTKIHRLYNRVVDSAFQRRNSRKRSEAHLQEPMTVPDDYDYDATIYPGDYLVDRLPPKESSKASK